MLWTIPLFAINLAHLKHILEKFLIHIKSLWLFIIRILCLHVDKNPETDVTLILVASTLSRTTCLPLFKSFLNLAFREAAQFLCWPSSAVEKCVHFSAELIIGYRKSLTLLNQGYPFKDSGFLYWLKLHCPGATSTLSFTLQAASF